MAHRDYAIRGDDIRVLMFSDRMEVYSPGRLPGHVTLDNLVTEALLPQRGDRPGALRPGLRRAARLRHRPHGCQHGRGRAACTVFEETVAGFRVTLPGRGEELVSLEASRAGATAGSIPARSAPWPTWPSTGRSPTVSSGSCAPNLSDETIRQRAGRPGGPGTHRQGEASARPRITC